MNFMLVPLFRPDFSAGLRGSHVGGIKNRAGLVDQH
jgi:hypothetical protein